MFGFKKLKRDVSTGMKKASGRTDFLEAVCASAALVTFADGSSSKNELDTAKQTIAANPTLSGAFKPQDIERTFDSMLKRAQAGRSGRMGLYKEIGDLADQNDTELSEAAYLCALDIAETEGGVGPEEAKVLQEIAKRFGLNPDSYANV